MMKTAVYIGWGVELLLIGLVFWIGSLNYVVGGILLYLWFTYGFGVVSTIAEEMAHPPEPSAPYEPVPARHHGLIGSTGKTVSALRPGGMVNVGGERVEATSALGLIEAGVAVRIVDAKGNVVIVEEQEEGDGALGATNDKGAGGSI